jgi:VWFA-related protein
MKRNFMFGLAIILAVLWFNGCGGGGGGSESGSNSNPTPTPTPTPSISTQGSLDFGVALINGSSSRQLLISNVGGGTLNIGQLSLVTAAEYSIRNDFCSNQSIPPQGSCSLALELRPTSQSDLISDTLSIPSNDSAQNPLTVALTGKGRALSVKINEVKRDGCGAGFLQILASVATSAGVPVSTLDIGNFTVYEDGGQQPKIINQVTTPILTPISVDLVLDYSGSLSSADQIAIQDAAKSFVARLTNASDEAEVIKFALTIDVVLPFTNDKVAVNTALEAQYTGDTGGTVLYDALVTAIDATALRINDRRAIIVFSDGNDEESTNTLAAVIDQAVLKGVPIFTIAYTNATRPKPEVMQQLAQETGGEYFLAPNSSDVTGIYDQIADILSQQYLIEYTTSSSGGASAFLDLLVNDLGNIGEDSKEAIGCP